MFNDFFTNPKIFTTTEILEEIKKLKSHKEAREEWKEYGENCIKILSRPDISISEAIAFAEKENDYQIWWAVFLRPDFSPADIVLYEGKIKPENAWVEAIFYPKSRGGFNTNSYRNDAKEYLEKILKPVERIEFAKKYKDKYDYVFNWAVSCLDFEKYFAELEGEEAVSFEKDLKLSWGGKILELNLKCKKFFEELTPSEVIAYCKKINSRNVNLRLLTRPDVQKYLMSIPITEAIDLAKTLIGGSVIWELIFPRHDMPVSEVLAYVKKSGSDIHMKINLPCVQEYLKKLTPLEFICFGIEFCCYYVFENEVLGDPKVKEYILDFSPKEAISFAKRMKHYSIWEMILGREDVKEYLKD